MKRLRFIALPIALFFFGTTHVFAQNDIGEARGDKKSETIKIAEMAKKLVNYGQLNEDPYTLVAAAKMLIRFDVADAGKDRVVAREGKSDAPDKTKGAGLKPIDLEAAAVLALAEAFAERNSAIIQVIKRLKQANTRSRGYAYGTGYIKVTHDIPAYGSREFKWTFTGNEPAEILFVGDTDTDIDVFVYDSKTGELLGQDESSDSGAYFSWTPPKTREYTFRVVNRGAYDNSTYIMSN